MRELFSCIGRVTMSAVKNDFTDEEKAALLLKIQKDLPEKWIVQFSKKHVNRVYFFNKIDGTRTWKHPGITTERQSGEELVGRKRKSNEYVSQYLPRDNDRSEARKMKAKRKSDGRTDTTFKKVLSGHSKTPQKESSDRTKFTRKKRKKNDKPGKSSTTPDSLACYDRHDTSEPSTSSDKVLSVRDVEMVDLNMKTAEREEEDKERLTEGGKSPEISLSVIVDTNILLHKHSHSSLEKAVQSYPFDGVVTFIIPWVVLQELDHLKKENSDARNAISFLNTQFQVNHSSIRGQSIFEAATVIDGLTIENNDDRILQCCFFMQQSSDKNTSVLLTHDKNLMNKAMVNGIRCIEDIANLTRIPYGTDAGSSSRFPVASLTKNTAPSMTVDRNENAIVNEKTTKGRMSPCSRDVYDESCTYIMPTLTFILEKEMKNAFDDLWLDVVLKKPPWSLKDVLLCIRKHWLAVFKVMGVDQIIQVHVERLINLHRSFCYKRAKDVVSLHEWLCSAISLIKGIDQKGKYGEAVESDLTKLQRLRKLVLTRVKVWNSETKSLPESLIREGDNTGSRTELEESSIEMTAADDATSDDFWVALDKIWTTIISHCGMIFQSLNYVPSRLKDSPEVCQALSASYQTIPQKPLAAKALPLVIELVQSLQTSLVKLTSLPVIDSECGPIFTDLLQTLWATIQAFHIDCKIHRLLNSQVELCQSIATSADMVRRLKTGLYQLEIVKDLMGECLAVISCKPFAQG